MVVLLHTTIWIGRLLIAPNLCGHISVLRIVAGTNAYFARRCPTILVCLLLTIRILLVLNHWGSHWRMGGPALWHLFFEELNRVEACRSLARHLLRLLLLSLAAYHLQGLVLLAVLVVCHVWSDLLLQELFLSVAQGLKLLFIWSLWCIITLWLPRTTRGDCYALMVRARGPTSSFPSYW